MFTGVPHLFPRDLPLKLDLPMSSQEGCSQEGTSKCDRKYKAFFGPSSAIPEYCFHHILFVKSRSQDQPRFKRKGPQKDMNVVKLGSFVVIFGY